MRYISARRWTAHLFTVVLTLLALTISSHGQSANASANTPPPDVKHGPIADSTQYLAGTTKVRSRQVENNNHPGTGEIKELPPGATRLPEIWDPVGSTESVPVKKADAIFIGEVTKASAVLSADRTSLFSIFDVKVSQVLLNNLGEPIQVGNTAQVERYGGRLKYPDGKMEAINVDGRHYPEVGSKYIFFVEQTPKKARWTSGNAEGLSIITAYEVRGGKVYALDKTHNAGALPYEKYDGTPEDKFLSIVGSTIQQVSKQAPTGGAL